MWTWKRRKVQSKMYYPPNINCEQEAVQHHDKIKIQARDLPERSSSKVVICLLINQSFLLIKTFCRSITLLFLLGWRTSMWLKLFLASHRMNRSETDVLGRDNNYEPSNHAFRSTFMADGFLWPTSSPGVNWLPIILCDSQTLSQFIMRCAHNQWQCEFSLKQFGHPDCIWFFLYYNAFIEKRQIKALPINERKDKTSSIWRWRYPPKSMNEPPAPTYSKSL